jgi:GNAT superfamily N-acetyltransferase
LAFSGDQVVGLINCFTGFSTFSAKPLLNIHDVVVPEVHRGQGIGQTLLSWAEAKARQLGCCKLTLEVLSNNTHALAAYHQAGYAPYMLDPAAGHALLMQKILSES